MDYICSVCGKKFTNGMQDDHGRIYCSEKCFQATCPHCDYCGKPMNSWTEKSDGRKYCSTKCLESTYPKCAICGKSMDQWISSSDGKKYCNEICYEKSLPICSICGKHMHNWLENDDGKLFCSENCADTIRPKCSICGKPVKSGYKDNEGNCYCSDDCYEISLPTCSVCGKPMHNGFQNSMGMFCSEICFNSVLPKCSVCGKPVNGGYTDKLGHYYCSDKCYEQSLPKCNYCGKHIKEWVETSDGIKYCDEQCYENNREHSQVKIEMKTALTADELAYLTGLSSNECQHFMTVNNMDGDEALEAIDIFMQSLNENIAVPLEIASCMNNAGIYSKMSSRLGAYNTMRGGVKGYGGFVFEEMHAADVATKGVNIKVLGNNGIADFIVKDSSGKEILVQAKAGYKPNQINWSKYKGQTIVVDKGNTVIANEARAAGLTVQESSIFKKQADIVARAQQWESKVTGKITAPLTGAVSSAHYAGMASAKLAARVGVSMKLGENIYDVISGEKDFSDAALDIVTDGVVLVGGAYVGGAALTFAGTAVTSTATMIAGTSVGAAFTGAVGTAATVASSTAIGGAIVAGTGTVVAGAASVVTAVASAPFLPVVAACAAVGFIGKWLKS
ncbi:hypothetical protein QUF55_05605 [Clostridiaceae bacterium HSG29]|nr:hypothetical protein [Clostridiaceae bacterium HSG29]